MAINSVRTALQLLTGAGEVTRAKALEAAGTLLELPGVGETSARAGQLAEELIEAATANQAMITDLIRTELDRRLVTLGLARGSDLEAVQRKLDALEAEVAALRAGTTKGPQAPRVASNAPAVPPTRPASKTTRRTAKKVPAASTKKTAAKKTAAEKTAASKRTTKKATTAKKATTKKDTAKKPAARTQ